ncbi:hypothetical protein IC229_33195 [Spirosoma sp. BT702]|uniref:Uncharacterized protein n=1 Tax=Spirosoma profusum TaxID=2771354 RepID=A0A927AW35_9BACT|nr:hypothetical protein [Spirosoma profusum]MBD2705515.1 hypothetical protein [Spirosoma profusum]
MTAALDQLDRLYALPVESIATVAVERHEDEITEFNREQLDKGLDSDGRSLGSYASRKYKGRLRPVDLLDTGAFRGSFNVDAQTGGFVVDATDSKTQKLTAKYGKAILGVSDENKPAIGEWIKDELISEIEQEL